MLLETITPEDFNRRLDAANERRSQELQEMEEQQAKAEQLLSYYERTLDEMEAGLTTKETSSALLRKRFRELAEKTAQVAASL